MTLGAMPWPMLPPGSSYPAPPGAVPGTIVRVGPRQYRAYPPSAWYAYGWWSPGEVLTSALSYPLRTASAISDRNNAVVEVDRAKKRQPLATPAAATSAATMSTVAGDPASAYFRSAWWLAVAVRMGAPAGLLATADSLMATGLRAMATPGAVLPSSQSVQAAYKAAYDLAAATPGVPEAVLSGLRAGATPPTSKWLWIGLGLAGVAVVGGLALRSGR